MSNIWDIKAETLIPLNTLRLGFRATKEGWRVLVDDVFIPEVFPTYRAAHLYVAGKYRLTSTAMADMYAERTVDPGVEEIAPAKPVNKYRKRETT